MKDIIGLKLYNSKKYLVMSLKSAMRVIKY